MKNFGNMIKQAQAMQKQMAGLQEQLAAERFEGSAGAGMVKVIVDGKLRLLEIKLAPKTLKESDPTLVEDLILTAVNEAQKRAEDRLSETLGRLTGGLNLPF